MDGKYQERAGRLRKGAGGDTKAIHQFYALSEVLHGRPRPTIHQPLEVWSDIYRSRETSRGEATETGEDLTSFLHWAPPFWGPCLTSNFLA